MFAGRCLFKVSGIRLTRCMEVRVHIAEIINMREGDIWLSNMTKGDRREAKHPVAEHILTPVDRASVGRTSLV